MNNTKNLKIGILGAGNIGKTLARKLAQAGHDVKVANSRGPETIPADALESGARAVTSAEAVQDVEVVILSINPTSYSKVAPLFAGLPEDTVVMDTSNYHPVRDNRIEAIDAGQVESLWVVEQLGRPIVKAWNTIVSDSFANKGKPVGSPDRIALPVAADRDRDREVGLALVEDTGFDAFDAGTLEDSWRMQPGSPVYCTDLTLAELPDALAWAERERLSKRRDLTWAILLERSEGTTLNPDPEYFLRLSRILQM
ncbi:NAD(P)-binding domain-containing protein [Microcoleus sp. AR_TQ3_B6]|uniref:NAD(P)-binding domain-containing protein n=1 Tax=Microcoleus sp. AR_TQ3_B6 TaxID=3055284 RepID=UPI002FD2F887